MGAYELALADAHEWLKGLPDASVDAVITDPPYGTTQLAFDALEVRWAEIWAGIYRVCKPAAVQVMFSAQPFTTDLINSNRNRFRYELIWPKTTATGYLNAKSRPLRNHENILLFSERGATTYNPQMQATSRKAYRVIRRTQSEHYCDRQKETVAAVLDGTRYPTTVLEHYPSQQAHSTHPTQKPLELLAYLVKTYTNPGDLVIDPFAGSGTTGHACIELGRRFTGCEIDPNYHAIAIKRLEAAAAQGRMFAEAT